MIGRFDRARWLMVFMALELLAGCGPWRDSESVAANYAVVARLDGEVMSGSATMRDDGTLAFAVTSSRDKGSRCEGWVAARTDGSVRGEARCTSFGDERLRVEGMADGRAALVTVVIIRPQSQTRS